MNKVDASLLCQPVGLSSAATWLPPCSSGGPPLPVPLVGQPCDGLQGRITQWARRQTRGKSLGWWLAERLVFREVRQQLGLDRCRHLGSAAAQLDPRTQEYLGSIGLPLVQIYGLTETSGGSTRG